MEKQYPKRSFAALNWLNFFAADVASGVGPFLAVYLAANQHWQPGPIGIAMSAMGFATVLAQTPAGFLIDRTTHKRSILIAASSLMGVMGIAIPFFPHLSFVTVAQIVMGIAAAFYGPTLIALAVCLVQKKDFDHTIGQNQTYNHAGNVASAVLIGVLGRYTNNEGVFYCLFALAIGCGLSVMAIRREDINHPEDVYEPNAHWQKEYSQKDHSQKEQSSTRLSVADLFRNKPFLLFLIAAFIFHFANAAMLPLVGQEMSKGQPINASLYMSACIILAQLVMIPVTAWCGKKAGSGRKWLLLIAYVILPIRGVLYTINTHAGYLVSIQILDGIAAGIFGVVSILVVNDLMGNSGRASLAQAMLATAVGLGASLSNLIAGYIVQFAGFTAGFLSLSALALAAMALVWIAMPETLPGNKKPKAGFLILQE